MKKLVGMSLLMVGIAGFLMGITPVVPEIDSGSLTTAVALLSGAFLITARRRK